MATIIVDTTLDENDGNVSLRDAIAAASSGDTITFASGPGEAFETGGTIPLNPVLGALVVSSVVTIDGDIDADGAPDVTVAGEAPVFASAGNGGDGGQGGPRRPRRRRGNRHGIHEHRIPRHRLGCGTGNAVAAFNDGIDAGDGDNSLAGDIQHNGASGAASLVFSMTTPAPAATAAGLPPSMTTSMAARAMTASSARRRTRAAAPSS